MKKPAGFLGKIINKASQIASIVAVVFLIGMMVLTVLDVVLRYFFNAPIQGSVELLQYFMVVAGFLGVAWCAVKEGHLKVDFIINKLPARYQATIDAITLLMAMTVVPIVAWQGFAHAEYTMLEKTASDILEIPDFPFYIIVGLGYALLFLALVPLLVKLIIKATKKDES